MGPLVASSGAREAPRATLVIAAIGKNFWRSSTVPRLSANHGVAERIGTSRGGFMSHRRSIRAWNSSRTSWVEVASAERKILVADLSERFASKADLTPCFGSAGCVFSNVSGNFLTVVNVSTRCRGGRARLALSASPRRTHTRARVEKHRTTMSPTSAQAERWLAKAGERSGANHAASRGRARFRDSRRSVEGPAEDSYRAQRRGLARFRRRLPLPRLHRPIPCRGHRGSSLARPRHPSRRDAARRATISARLGLREKVAEADTTRFSLATPSLPRR